MVGTPPKITGFHSFTAIYARFAPLLPAPPIILMTIASIAFAVALRTSVQGAPSCSDGVVAHRSSAPRD